MGLDRRTVIAVVLCIVFLILYRPLLRLVGLDRYLPAPTPTAVDSTRRDTSTVAVAPVPAPSAPSSGTPADRPGSELSTFKRAPTDSTALERSYQLETPLYRATFSDRGARLISIELLHYASANGASAKNGRAFRVPASQPVPPDERVVLAGGPLFGVDLGSGAARRDLSNVEFAVRESLDAGGNTVALTFVATDGVGATVRQTYRARPDNYVIDLDVELSAIPTEWRTPDYSLGIRSWAPITEADEVADARALRATSLVGTNVHREHAARLVDHPRTFEGNAAWAAVQSRYFVAGVAIDKGSGRGVQSSAVRRPLNPGERAAFPAGSKPETEVAINTLVVGLPSQLQPVQRFVIYAGPAEYFRLAALKVQFERVVDLGWNWIRPFSQAMLFVLKWLYGLVHNYGIAIILLATLVRLLLHPLNVMSIRSMRAMQRIQPELERIREKYKNDPQALNTAMMALYKENRVNPAGGCLPMLLQIPVFVALYNVLFNAIELRQAPFVAWIHDLSAPDLLVQVGPIPIRLLPLLMLGSGLLSQKFTPTDPRQLTTMYLMNVFMLVFFYNLPSGLVLYWTLMNLLTAIQQWSVLRKDGHAPVAVPEVPVPKPRRRAARG